MRQARTTLLSVCAALAICAWAPSARAADPASHGFSAEKLGEIQTFMDTAVAQKRIPAAISMIARNGEIIWLGTAGEMGPGVPMRKDAIVPLASVGKMYTATAAMILVEKGMIGLDDPVSKFIPEFADVQIEVTNKAGEKTLTAPERPITVRHLLTHTSGLTVDGNAFWGAWFPHVMQTTTTDFAKALAELPLQSQPGTVYKYGITGAAYEVLGAVIEIASGQTLEAFMNAEIFEPLGLEDSYFYVPQDKADRIPGFYRKGLDGSFAVSRPHGTDLPRTKYFFGGGGVQASPEDILGFASLFLNEGVSNGTRILKPETVRMMMSDQIGELSDFPDPNQSWGFGGAVRFTDRQSEDGVLLTYGWVGGGYAIMWVDLVEKFVAYFAFTIEAPGDAEVLYQYPGLVYGAMTESYRQDGE